MYGRYEAGHSDRGHSGRGFGLKGPARPSQTRRAAGEADSEQNPVGRGRQDS